MLIFPQHSENLAVIGALQDTTPYIFRAKPINHPQVANSSRPNQAIVLPLIESQGHWVSPGS